MVIHGLECSQKLDPKCSAGVDGNRTAGPPAGLMYALDGLELTRVSTGGEVDGMNEWRERDGRIKACR